MPSLECAGRAGCIRGGARPVIFKSGSDDFAKLCDKSRSHDFSEIRIAVKCSKRIYLSAMYHLTRICSHTGAPLAIQDANSGCPVTICAWLGCNVLPSLHPSGALLTINGIAPLSVPPPSGGAFPYQYRYWVVLGSQP